MPDRVYFSSIYNDLSQKTGFFTDKITIYFETEILTDLPF